MSKWTFQVLPRGERPPKTAALGWVYLVRDNWNDFGFRTAFQMHVADRKGIVTAIGTWKIGKTGMGVESSPSVPVPTTFKKLDAAYFSLGQDPDAYELLLKLLGQENANSMLDRLQDLGRTPHRLDELESEAVLAVSLLRFISTSVVRDQLNRITRGGNAKQGFSFTYDVVGDPGSLLAPSLTFDVEPNSFPPSNVHVLIGSNGSGKTRLLRGIRDSLDGEAFGPTEAGRLRLSDVDKVTSLVSVSYSAFDLYPHVTKRPRSKNAFQVSYVGLTREVSPGADDEALTTPKSPSELADEFASVLRLCTDTKAERLATVLRFLETDPALSRIQIGELNGLAERLDFGTLSSGHKIVLLTLVSLVSVVEEKTLVLIDEPESHLHPPLLAAFTRALSWLMTDRNGVAIVATHSPVVLQGVPADCVWKISRYGDELNVTRPTLQTFGENLGVLTQEVFVLETAHSGYHTMLKEVASNANSFEEALGRFDGKLGFEAQSILRLLMMQPLDGSIDDPA